MLSSAEFLNTLPADPSLDDLREMLASQAPGDDAAGMFARLAFIAARALAELREKRSALELTERRFEATFAQGPVGIAHVALDGTFLLVNDQFAQITGHSVEALMRHGFQQITHPDDLASDMAHVERLLSGDADRYVMEKRYLRPDRSTVWINLTVALIRDAAGLPEFFVSVIEDTSEVRRAHAEAIRDPLTGLLNRRGFLDLMTSEIARASLTGSAIGLVYLDLDGFKGINDVQGHAAGDACLTHVARTMETATRPGDMLARIGGDEFTILMPQISTEAAGDVAERLRLAIGDGGSGVSGSFGVMSIVPDDDITAESLIAAADQAMLLAKRDGKNCVRFAGS